MKLEKKIILVSLLAALTMLITPVAAHHLLPGQTCDVSTYKCPPIGAVYPPGRGASCVCGELDIIGCHVPYYCPASPRLPDVGVNLVDSVVTAGQNFAETDALRKTTGRLTEEQAQYVVNQEEELTLYYEEILKKNPRNFWANWDYAALKKNQGNYQGADTLYHAAVSTLNQKARVELETSLRIETVGRLQLSRIPTQQKSPLITKLGDSIRSAFKLRNDPNSDYDTEKLTWKAKLAKRVGLYNEYEYYNKCVAGTNSIGGCIVTDLIGVSE